MPTLEQIDKAIDALRRKREDYEALRRELAILTEGIEIAERGQVPVDAIYRLPLFKVRSLIADELRLITQKLEEMAKAPL